MTHKILVNDILENTLQIDNILASSTKDKKKLICRTVINNMIPDSGTFSYVVFIVLIANSIVAVQNSNLNYVIEEYNKY